MHEDLRIGLVSRRELAEFSSCSVNAFSRDGNRDFACVGTVRIYLFALQCSRTSWQCGETMRSCWKVYKSYKLYELHDVYKYMDVESLGDI